MAENSHLKPSKTLILGPEWLTEIKSSAIKVFSSFEELLDNLSQASNNDDSFRLFVPSQYLKELIDKNVYKLIYVDSINIYYNSELDYRLHIHSYQSISNKLNFLVTTDLMTRVLAAIHPYFNDQAGPDHQSISKPTVVRRRKKKKKSKLVVVSNTIPFDMKCHKCLSVFDDPFQLVCGHRQFQDCFLISLIQCSTSIKCAECEEETPREEVWLDRGFKKQLDQLTSTT
ncbi:unnamed protein product [Rotaria magnacalcarata]|uniref:Uncharacterized protein n=1 Tax=Rotaria magnacalcarata TaxID=392030 RepID=A0A8S2NG49_9BILA|nr:unnamed protein product [Rotaria magnacalcarata]